MASSDSTMQASSGNGLAIDPVCKMTVDPATAQHSAEHEGTTYYFCAGGCRKAFVADPVRFLEPSPAAAPTGAISLGLTTRRADPRT